MRIPLLLCLRRPVFQSIQNIVLQQFLVRYTHFDRHSCWTMLPVPGKTKKWENISKSLHFNIASQQSQAMGDGKSQKSRSHLYLPLWMGKRCIILNIELKKKKEKSIKWSNPKRKDLLRFEKAFRTPFFPQCPGKLQEVIWNHGKETEFQRYCIRVENHTTDPYYHKTKYSGVRSEDMSFWNKSHPLEE